MRLKVGDKVTIRRDLKRGKYGLLNVVEDMLRYAGQTFTIRKIEDNPLKTIYKLQGIDRDWSWSEGMFENKSKSKLIKKL